uniref:Metallothionein type 3 n=2 Tax=Neltuma TaxID=3082578 RepID=A0A075FFC0_9FABA|nr:type 3 metallothionein [Prosopis juliflora]AIE88423.1 metallothionein type 3 [Prosopis glandulosa]
MSDKCGNCDCADKSQCVKKGNGYVADIIDPDNSYDESYMMAGAAAGEHDGKCKCGPSCSCVDCTCGH